MFLKNDISRAGLHWCNKKKCASQYGGAAIEYIIVSTFATLLAVAAISFVTSSIKEKLADLEQRTGISFDTESIDLFGNQ